MHDSATFSNLQLVNEFQELCDPRQRALLSVLAICEKHNMPSSKLVQSLADDLPRTPLEARRRTRGLYWSRVEEFSKVVDGPSSPYESMLPHPGLLPAYVNLAMHWRQSEGTAASLSQAWLDRPSDSLFDNPSQKSFFNIALPLMIKALFVLQIVGFVMLKVVPEFKQMMAEFEVEHSPVFDLTITIADTAVKFWFLPVLVMIIAMIFLIPSLQRYFRRWNPFAWQKTSTKRSVLNRQILALEITHPHQTDKSIPRKPMEGGIGELDWEQIKASKVITNREAQILETAGSADVQAWLLRRSAGKRGQRSNSRGIALTRSFATLVNIGIGVIVFLLAISIFSTLIGIMAQI